MTDDLLKIPVRLTKITSKVAQDHENMWVMWFEAHETQAEGIATLIPFVNTADFVMVLVKVADIKETKEAIEDEIDLSEDEDCQKQAPKKAVRKKKPSKRAQ